MQWDHRFSSLSGHDFIIENGLTNNLISGGGFGGGHGKNGIVQIKFYLLISLTNVHWLRRRRRQSGVAKLKFVLDECSDQGIPLKFIHG